ncbi:MAG: glutamate-1-semialdehyde 2,1-aminomutase [Tepidisphaerales bacterium]
MAKSSPRTIAHSQAAFAKAQQVMPGGVSSPVRAFKAVGGTPIFIREGEGSKIRDIDGNEYIDYVASYGPLIAGHCNEAVVAALSKAIGKGTSFGAPTEQETLLAALICDAIASVDMIRFVNSGTEATMSALRLVRAATGREKIVKCVGCYHGHVDSMLVSAGSGALTLGAPSSPGVPATVAATTLLVQYNDLEGARAIFSQNPGQIACFCIEPVPGNMGVILPTAGYLQGLRELCDQHGALLLFDEVMSGFRVAFGGAQEKFGVRPDLTCLGKVIGGGLPIGAYGGRKDLMEMISPSGKVYQAGTLSGNPLATSAGVAMVEMLREPGLYDLLETKSAYLEDGLAKAARKAGVPLTINRCGSMITPFFVKQDGQPVTNFDQATACDTAAYSVFFNGMLEKGVYLPPSQFESWFVGLAHSQEDLDTTIKAAGLAFKQVVAKRAG